jgi:DNA-binding SARP family transcriptional activator
MAKKNRLSRDQKRKAKLAKEARKNRQGHSLAYDGNRYKTDALIGVLRTILNSIDVWSTPGPNSVGYLHYIEGFLKKQGVTFEKQTPAGEVLEEPEEDELYLIGQEWCFEHDQAAAADFKELAEELIRSGQAERVTNICQRLIAEATMEPEVLPELMVLSMQAQQAMKRDMG